MKRRLDALLVERGLVETRSRAQALVMAGRVLVDGVAVTKAGTPTAAQSDVRVTEPPRYVSRGGEKLETGLRRFGIDVRGERCLDVGASTGGFTDCLLQHGAEAVVALDVGRGQLHERLRADPRVTVLEGMNARALDCAALPFQPTFVTADVSFISLRLALPPALACAAAGWRALALAKPQFEAGREHVRGGVVRDPEVRAQVLRSLCGFLAERGVAVLGVCDSCLPGPAGNREYLLALTAASDPLARTGAIHVESAIRDAVDPP